MGLHLGIELNSENRFVPLWHDSFDDNVSHSAQKQGSSQHGRNTYK